MAELTGLLTAAEVASMRATLDQVTNAAILKIAGPGAPDRNGDPVDGATLWEGEALGYLEQVSRDEIGPTGQATVHTTVFTVLDDAGVPAVEIPGPAWEESVVTIEDRRTDPVVTLVRGVKGMEHSAFGTLDSVRLELEDARVDG